MDIKIGVSNRHVHLNRNDFEKLFGSDYELTKLKDLSQIGQYACQEQVTLKGSKGTIENVRVLGPLRSYTQAEVSKTDAYKLGLNPPVRESGDLENSETITLIGPNGEVEVENGCIIANRHIHISTKERKELGLENVDKVSVEFGGEKGGVMHNVYIKEAEDFVYEMHIDTDDANAHLIKNGDIGNIIL